jgi:hypothetical protein
VSFSFGMTIDSRTEREGWNETIDRMTRVEIYDNAGWSRADLGQNSYRLQQENRADHEANCSDSSRQESGRQKQAAILPWFTTSCSAHRLEIF